MKKGQMEYGWIILACVVVVASLSAFGVFSPNPNFKNTNIYLSGQDYTCEDILLNLNKLSYDVRIPNCQHIFDVNRSTGEQYMIGCDCNVLYCKYGLFGQVKGIKECENVHLYINATEISEITGIIMKHIN